MYRIMDLNGQPKQQIKVIVANNRVLKIDFTYSENQKCWFFDFDYNNGKFISKGHKLSNCPNIIRQYKNTLPFGIACYVIDGLEPWFLNDFVTGRVQFYILEKAEVQSLEQNLYGKVW